jgi:hypothetical protein
VDSLAPGAASLPRRPERRLVDAISATPQFGPCDGDGGARVRKAIVSVAAGDPAALLAWVFDQ